MRSMSAYRAEGSNEERQKKSIAGQTTALKEGRWTFCPKPGYKKGTQRGIPEVDDLRGPALKQVLIKISEYLITPTEGLKELNKSNFTKGHSQYKMDKFRKIATDPFYAGILVIDKQVKVTNEGGLHEPLITRQQHYKLVQIFDRRKKTQLGPRKNGNPKYPANNITICDACTSLQNGRFVGFDHSNGKNLNRIYESYRCRACGKYLSRDELHEEITKQFKNNPITTDGINDFMDALNKVWKQEEEQAMHEVARMKSKIQTLRIIIENKVDAATDPSNVSIKEDILELIKNKRVEIEELEERISELQTQAYADKEQFLRSALNFAQKTSEAFFDPNLSQDNKLRCKQILFPAGFYVDKNKKVYTPDKSYLITLLPTKKVANATEKSQLVQHS